MARLLRALLASVALCLASCLALVPALDVDAYLGRWVLMYTSLPTLVFQSRTCVGALYTPNPNGTIRVLNFDRPDGPAGPLRTIEGYAEQDPTQPGQLYVRFPGSARAGDYGIVALGAPTPPSPLYPWAVVSDQRMLAMFVLARDSAVYREVYDEGVQELLRERGFTAFYNRPLEVEQGPSCPVVEDAELGGGGAAGRS